MLLFIVQTTAALSFGGIMFIAARKIPALLELPDEPRAESFNFKPRILPVLKLSSAGLKRRWQGLKNYRLSVSLEHPPELITSRGSLTAKQRFCKAKIGGSIPLLGSILLF